MYDTSIKSPTAFPSIAETGKIYGSVTGRLIAFGLYFGSKIPDFERMNMTIIISQQFISDFENKIGYSLCSDIIENVILGYK